jgi:selenium metabolism protein YedF
MDCCQPLISAKQALEGLKEGEFTIIVSDPSSCENVRRFASGQGYSVEGEKKGNDFYLRIRKAVRAEKDNVSGKEERVVVYVNSDRVGIGDRALGSILMSSFLETLLDLQTKPNSLILINGGCRLSAEGSDVVETLTLLSEAGTKVLTCGTCLDFHGMKEKLRVGTISNMYEIAKLLLEADRLIRP